MVTPYVVASHEEGWDVTRQIRDSLDLHFRILEKRDPLRSNAR